MIKGLFTAASSMVATRRNLDVVANNLANADTTGFKRKEGVRQSFPEMMMSRIEKQKPTKEIGSMGTGVFLEETYTDFSSGEFQYTGKGLDFAIEGDGFFMIQGSDQVFYTKNGDFTLDSEGYLVTQQGYHVLGNNQQQLQVVEGEDINIDAEGRIHSGLQGADQIGIASFNDQSLLQKIGENLYQTGEAEEELAENFQVRQYYLEGSNVNIVEEMVKMIEKNRLYEANQKMITAMDENLGQAVNEIGQVR